MVQYDTEQSAAVKRSPYWRPTKAHRLASEFFEDSVPTVFTSYRDQGSLTRIGSVIPPLPLALPSSRSTASEPVRRMVINVDPENSEEDEGVDTAEEGKDEDEDEEPEDSIGDSLSSLMMATLRAWSLEEQTDDFLDTVPVPIAIQTVQLPASSSTPSQLSVLGQPVPSLPALSQPSIPNQPVLSQSILSQPSILTLPDDDEYFDAMEDQLADPEANNILASCSSGMAQLADQSQQPSRTIIGIVLVWWGFKAHRQLSSSRLQSDFTGSFSCCCSDENVSSSQFASSTSPVLSQMHQDLLPSAALNNHTSTLYLAFSSSHVYEHHASSASLLSYDLRQNDCIFSAASAIQNNEHYYSTALPQSILLDTNKVEYYSSAESSHAGSSYPVPGISAVPPLESRPAESYSNWFDVDIRKWKSRAVSSIRYSGMIATKRQDNEGRADVEAPNERNADAKQEDSSFTTPPTPPSAQTTSSPALHQPYAPSILTLVQINSELPPRGIKRRRDDDEVIPSDRPTKRRKTCFTVLSESSSAVDCSPLVPSTSDVKADIEQQVSTSRHLCVSFNPPYPLPHPSPVRSPEPCLPSKSRKRCRDEEECTSPSRTPATQGRTKRRRSDVSSSIDRAKPSTSAPRSLKLVSDTSGRRVQDAGSQKPRKKSRLEDKENTGPCAPETSLQHATKLASHARNVSDASKPSTLDDSLVENRS
ncbi:hypothetical protein BDQ17DRAFT_1454889 [Cyathus striatus]|nr:hypothetical protein BDQ17DRAFT_1454889 [Cyathus striatus]